MAPSILPNFAPTVFYDDVDDTRPIADLLDIFIDGANALADEARQAAAAHAQQAENWRQAHAAEDREAAVSARNTMWKAVRSLHTNLFNLDLIWNRLAPRADQNTTGQ